MTNPRRVYLDNAATTALDSEVLETMLPLFKEVFGNPSSIHHFGRKAKSALEMARKNMAQLLGISTQELVFTSGGTEADNMAIRMSVENLGVKTIISSPIEHHAVINTIHELAEKGKVELILLKVNEKGQFDINELENYLKNKNNVLVSLMHGNNEIGNLISIEQIGKLCQTYQAIFHSDTVQTIGQYKLNLSELPLDFAVGAAHKFNGPKGVGFLYINKRLKLQPFITGGGQERGMRAGTENLPGIVGMSKALEISLATLDSKQTKLKHIKKQFIEYLQSDYQDVRFNGDLENSLYSVLNVSFPAIIPSELFLFQLDLHGISASGGSACSSGSAKGSHVLEALGLHQNRNNIRFSFGKNTELEDIIYCREQLKMIFNSQSNLGN